MAYHHLAMATRDMQATHVFYSKAMGFDLVKVEIARTPDDGWAKHFFYDSGDDELMAFWELHDESLPQEFETGLSRAAGLPEWVNHVAFKAPLDKIEQYRDRLIARGIDCTDMVNHADVETKPGVDRVSEDVDDTTWVRSFYFFDPDGIMLEFCADVTAGTDFIEVPVNAEGVKSGEPALA